MGSGSFFQLFKVVAMASVVRFTRYCIDMLVVKTRMLQLEFELFSAFGFELGNFAHRQYAIGQCAQ